MNINTMEQRLIISELMKKMKATKNELAEALIVSGLDSLEPLPAKNAVRANIIALQRKLQGRGIRFVNTKINRGTTYTITEEAYEFLLDNYSEAEYDENGAMVGLTILYPPFSIQEE